MNYQKHQPNLTETNGGAYIGGDAQAGHDFIGRDKIVIESGNQVQLIIDGQPVQLPSREELLDYCREIQARFARWADEGTDPPFYHQEDQDADVYIETAARPLPMRISSLRQQPMGESSDDPGQRLITILDESTRAIILGEPGSGKTTALERLAWQIATETIALEVTATEPLALPLFVRLAEYRGGADLIPLCTAALNRLGLPEINEATLVQLLRASNVTVVLLLDGLNEIDQVHQLRGPQLVRDHSLRYPAQRIYVTCRTADFDRDAQTDPTQQIMADAPNYQVQPLLDTIRYWGDETGESDLRSYLRLHLGEAAGKTLYERLRSDEWLYDLAHLPLFLWMFKETAGGVAGELPADRGKLLAAFVDAPRLLGRIPLPLRPAAKQSIEAIGWAMQENGSLELDEERLYDALESAEDCWDSDNYLGLRLARASS